MHGVLSLSRQVKLDGLVGRGRWGSSCYKLLPQQQQLWDLHNNNNSYVGDLWPAFEDGRQHENRWEEEEEGRGYIEKSRTTIEGIMLYFFMDIGGLHNTSGVHDSWFRAKNINPCECSARQPLCTSRYGDSLLVNTRPFESWTYMHAGCGLDALGASELASCPCNAQKYGRTEYIYISSLTIFNNAPVKQATVKCTKKKAISSPFEN